MFSDEITQLAVQVLESCRARGWRLATAESCTGGLISAALTGVSGASDVFTHGFITYANGAKIQMLGVPEALLAEHGAVSEPVARAMAEGALKAAGADIAISVTGIAGPSGGSAQKSVGLVHLACACKGLETMEISEIFTGDRDAVRLQAVKAALGLILSVIASASEAIQR